MLLHQLCISHVIYQSFDDRLETRTVFLDLSKAFNKVWHGGLLSKLKQNGISHNPLNSIIDVLNQRIILNGHYSICFDIEARVSLGSILGPLFFPIYISDLSDDLTLNLKLFADDTSLFSIVKNVNSRTTDLTVILVK